MQRRATEVSNFLQMLRSSSGNKSEATKTHGISHSDWKVRSLLLGVSICMYNICFHVNARLFLSLEWVIMGGTLRVS